VSDPGLQNKLQVPLIERNQIIQTFAAHASAKALAYRIRLRCTHWCSQYFATQWSNGKTEGQVNRLKAIKRQMYGRAGFTLLRRRVLPWSPAASP
jgi:transposase